MVKVPLDKLHEFFGDRLQENCSMSHYTTVRIGGPAAALLPLNSEGELVEAVQTLWELRVPYILVGSGSNILVSDKGYEGVILLNRAHNIKINSKDDQPSVYAESGANLSMLARQTALRGLSGMEWAASVPGTVGGAVYGNAGAHGSDIKANLKMATILHPINGLEKWPASQMDFQYRSSSIKREKSGAVIISALFNLEGSSREEAWEKVKQYGEHRQRTQPPGPSCGSTFKNPPGDYAGRLIEAVGLKGVKEGDAQISTMHANFFLNTGRASAVDYYHLIKLAQARVMEQFKIKLELEIELIGEFND